jgi:hypothetical protein
VRNVFGVLRRCGLAELRIAETIDVEAGVGDQAQASEPKSGQGRTIILEKPEVGLHPQAVLATGLLVLDFARPQ